LSLGNFWDDGAYVDANLAEFENRRYALLRPNRAYLALQKWHGEKSVDWAFERNSKTLTKDGRLKETQNLLLTGAAFIMGGTTAELSHLVKNLPHNVKKMSLLPGESDILVIGFARVCKGNKDLGALVILAPQRSWWMNRPAGTKEYPVHTPAGWHEFMNGEGRLPVVPGKSLEMTTLEPWLSQCNTQAWVNMNVKGDLPEPRPGR
jgi:hypothetical protein